MRAAPDTIVGTCISLIVAFMGAALAAIRAPLLQVRCGSGNRPPGVRRRP